MFYFARKREDFEKFYAWFFRLQQIQFARKITRLQFFMSRRRRQKGWPKSLSVVGIRWEIVQKMKLDCNEYTS